MPLPIVAIDAPELRGPLPESSITDAGSAVMADFVSPAIMETLETKPDPWRSSPFAPLRRLTSVQKSKVARAMLGAWFGSVGIPVTVKTIAGNATLIFPNDQLTVVKLSMRWDEGQYHFQQVKDWDYQQALLFGLSPQQAHLWIVPREEIMTRSVPQHGQNSRMLVFPAVEPPAWLRQYGGTLEQAASILMQALSRAA